MNRRDVLLCFISAGVVLDRYWPPDGRRTASVRMRQAFERAEHAGDLALHHDDDGYTYATLTSQSRSKVDRIIGSWNRKIAP